MSRIDSSTAKAVIMYLRTLPEAKIKKIRFATARFLYETAVKNGLLNIPMMDDLLFYPN